MRTLQLIPVIRAARVLALATIVHTFSTGLAFAQAPLRPRTLPVCSQVGQQVKLTLNTGTAGGFPPPGTADPIWRIVLPSAITPFTTKPVNAPAVWLPNSATEKWIQPAATGNPGTFPAGTYVYSTQFVTPVDPFLYSSITITGNFAADDSAIVKLNGVPIANCPAGTNPATWCFHSLKPIPPGVGWPTFNRFSGFLNTLTIEVKNTLANSPSGLLVRADVIGVCSKCTTTPPPEPPCGGNPSTC